MKEKHKTIIGSLDQAIWDELKLARNQKINKRVFFSLFYFYLEILNVKIIYFIYLETTRISESLFFFSNVNTFILERGKINLNFVP